MGRCWRTFAARVGAVLVVGATACLLIPSGACDDPGDGQGGDADGDADLDVDQDDADQPFDSGPPCFAALPVDLLFVVDNSNSMQEEQASLVENFPELVEALTQPPDLDGNGYEDYPPVEDLRVGVVSTDMGVGTDLVTGCDPAGDGGSLISATRSDDEACEGFVTGEDPWLQLETDGAEDLAHGFSCLARLGTTGCGYEQQLAAAVAALIDNAAPGGANEGFVRSESLLAVVFVTDEDDCSVSDDSLFDPSPAAEGALGPSGTRCAFHAELLRTIDEVVVALDPLRLDRPAGMLVAVIAGVPSDLVADPEAVDYDALLADEAMQCRVDPEDERALMPACTAVGVGSAAPARRLVEFVRTFSPGQRGMVQTICSSDLRPAMEALARMIARRLCDRPI